MMDDLFYFLNFTLAQLRWTGTDILLLLRRKFKKEIKTGIIFERNILLGPVISDKLYTLYCNVRVNKDASQCGRCGRPARLNNLPSKSPG